MKINFLNGFFSFILMHLRSMGAKKRKGSVHAAAGREKVVKKGKNEEIFKRTGLWEKFDDVIKSIKNKRFKPVVDRLHQQLNIQTRYCLNMISAFGQYWGKKLAAENNEMTAEDGIDVENENDMEEKKK